MKTLIFVLLVFAVVEGQELMTFKYAGIDWENQLINNNEPDAAIFENKIVIGTNYRLLNSSHTQYDRKEIAIYVSADFGEMEQYNNLTHYDDLARPSELLIVNPVFPWI